MSNDTELSKKFTISDYNKAKAKKDKNKIAKMIVCRFEERYVLPIMNSNSKHGFAQLAISCLLIETLESFYQGWPETRGKSQCAFELFFDREAGFAEFRTVASSFYSDVRCGILHQAETRKGWTICRKGPLLAGRRINATKFLSLLHESVRQYGTLLENRSWESAIWMKCRNKLDEICSSS